MRYLLIFFTLTFQGQVLHHQMLSSQGLSKKMPDGSIIRQTIGQQTLIGTSSNNYVVMQGFQQSIWGKYIYSNLIDDIKTTTYPNPFIETINFQFSKPINGLIEVNIFDIVGRKIFELKKKSNDNILIIDLSLLPSSEYLIRLNAFNFSYYTKIIKL
ncbi:MULTISPECIES: T9SS type A sorting domain-containing protein [Flavobacterium]|uniref:T9SS type A sorting domain-containing protein n=1 Tax=Flavobacterium gawalongense TaxID=2594432 RepID=A0A553B9E7_9FLAO|nr:T9SS type A sorting domain-containing protein [Flavobacterium gawalongense]TRW96119.1 T9SS type A sorting domain-containing protein [Flavobacterium gawalongense]TRX00868.1 T9SS type A sorting domain-containing protein [Flavobacterium gawalongense]TRX04866.1 T9SS type A sorting domain-containing protein [Flavobacterium gawalongense]TRX05558.1 T9SS type A sorting domain-containing protein [Flavobacterium gawalongense]TRX21426.1 T9SS type A sorting domain-containing protein [Flavobacterium gaw